ncbi:hypothetical protein GCM10009347_14320 [Shewanella algicola]|uniref:Uncharacterized protein n=1 Tax=Shewanella algicola TaxID=640633 RepID=A0A9X2CBQ1_9GAMM|nr:hypothetical protein [Shewanella algicola]MCL1105053.1 hypothetical protein [Shewanella algicola]GGP48318.1 hypothetical protein GCM10009347_14320 [Shewanella algicola]
MRGWIGLAIIAGIVYYFATETDKLDKPINDIKSMFTKADNKLDSMTGTKIIKIDKHIPQVKSEIRERLSTQESRELDRVFASNESIAEFKTQYCNSSARHSVFSKENLQFICDKI